MTRSNMTSFKVGLLWRGEGQSARAVRPASSRFSAIFAALARRGLHAEPVVYAEKCTDAIRQQLLQMDAVLVWVNPVSAGKRREGLDALLRHVSAAGVLVSAHPDVIDKMGVKSVLHQTGALSWGTDTHFYATAEAFAAEFPGRLVQTGPRVLKQNRGNGGSGVWRVSALADGLVEILGAGGAEPPQIRTMHDFMADWSEDFGIAGGLVDQAFIARHLEGMVRCYMSGGKVVGFGHQLVRALADRAAGPAGPRVYTGPDDARFQTLRGSMEGDWTPGMLRELRLDPADLPVIWDADFLLGPGTPDGQDTFVLCEINASSVFPIPDEAPDALAQTLIERLESPREHAAI